MVTWTLKIKKYLKYALTYIELIEINLTISRDTRKQVFKDLVRDIKHLKRITFSYLRYSLNMLS